MYENFEVENDNKIVKYTLFAFAVYTLMYSFFDAYVMSAISCILLIVLIPFNRKLAFVFYFVSFFVTEACFVEISGGIIKPYHFMTIILCIYFLPGILRLLNTVYAQLICAFGFAVLLACLFCDSVRSALLSSISLFINLMIIFPVGVIVRGEYIGISELKRLLKTSFAVLVVCGYVQYLIFSLTGNTFLGTIESQISNIKAGLMVGYSYESNGYGKIITFFTAMFLFDVIDEEQWSDIILLILAIGTFILSPTRTATYALILMIFILIVFISRINYMTKLLKYLFGVMCVICLFVVLIQSGVIKMDGYGLYKFQNFFVRDLSSDGSAAVRSDAMINTLKIAFSDLRLFLTGQGWGNATFQSGLSNNVTILGGNDLLNVLTYSGFIGIITYAGIMVRNIRFYLRGAYEFEDERRANCYSLSIVNLFLLIFGFFSGMINYPEMFMAFGMCFYNPYITDSDC